ncbi:MAG: fibronectin type III domain-containing protein [candidate division Zixibacteria bacterium]|nr:fibronectin type III domain-containing protein [candidate division Zixibacteria bacterium]NIR64591.1 fibronectin type III domain-containing protein [candidate division Zixibacteria bacterium]NIS16714.1 fibronectin type III domain-containing protein [candidate division Zixibacteria bacterium]NIS46449.1 fibronectin type III domain-containing protein [candidate division Zixibacteria bacterium]NIT53103.1 fibronectin type III domain-containing protein [candidate division Zixibacteria bacterium]
MLIKRILIISLWCLFASADLLPAQDNPPANINTEFSQRFQLEPPTDFKVKDTPNDNGGSLTLTWRLSPDDNLWGKRGLVEKYVIGRRVAGEEHFNFISTATNQSRSAFDNSVNNKDSYEYQLAAYPFKYIFRPIPWNSIMMVKQMERFKTLAPWISLNPHGVILSMLSQNYSYYLDLNGYQSDLAQKSIWENFSAGTELAGPEEIALTFAASNLISPFTPYFSFYLQSSLTSDPYQLITIGRYLGEGLMARTDVAGPVKTKKSWLNMRRVNVLVITVVLSFFILYFIRQARKGKELFIRKIAGLDAVEEAVGRATEMGKEIFFIPGTQDMQNIQTIAGVTILGRVARLTAEMDTKLEVPVSRSLVMVTAREIVQEAYANAGRPEAFDEDMVHYLTDDQFGYAAAIDGKMVRQRPATIFYMGAFYAESLILAETGNSIDAIQIAGTAMPAQLPFFVAACDYTLIGEELFAASAYLSKEPKLLGSLKGQDIGKALLLIALAVGVIVQTFGWFDFASLFRV